MDSIVTTHRITEWLRQQVDPAFARLREKLAGSGTPVQWDQEDFVRTMRMQVGITKITYIITLDPDSVPLAGTLSFKTSEMENGRSFSPALDVHSKAPGEMTGSDIVNDLINQYREWLRHAQHRGGTPDG